jgi:hypothetical protein
MIYLFLSLSLTVCLSIYLYIDLSIYLAELEALYRSSDKKATLTPIIHTIESPPLLSSQQGEARKQRLGKKTKKERERDGGRERKSEREREREKER